MDNFPLKNQRRREEMAIALRTEKREEVLAARRKRRLYRGAFGNQIVADYNYMAMGTIAQHNLRGQ